MPSRRSSGTTSSRIAGLRAIASPARQELISEVSHGPVSARELAARLGRSPQAVHFHLGVLEKAGLIRVAGERGSGRDAERTYQIVPGATKLGAMPTSPQERAAAVRATTSLLRIAGRELRSTIMGTDECTAIAVALRAKARLDERALKQLRTLIGELTDLFKAAKKANAGGRMTALTLVLTPTRDFKEKPPSIQRKGAH